MGSGRRPRTTSEPKVVRIRPPRSPRRLIVAGVAVLALLADAVGFGVWRTEPTAVAAPLPETVFGCGSPASKQTYEVPAGATAITVLVEGAQGGDGGATAGDGSAGGDGGPGSRVIADLRVTPLEKLTVWVGCRGGSGWSSGGGGGSGGPVAGCKGGGGTGGGSSAVIREVSGSPEVRLVVAGGGGGGGGAGLTCGIDGGGGGGSAGAPGDNGGKHSVGGPGGTGGGQNGNPNGTNGTTGGNGNGGGGGGGGGGAGCQGGTGGSGSDSTGAGGGGGGSSCVNTDTALVLHNEIGKHGQTGPGGHLGDGWVKIVPYGITAEPAATNSASNKDVDDTVDDDGDIIVFRAVVSNISNRPVTLDSVGGTMIVAPGTDPETVSCQTVTIPVGGSVACTGDHTLSQADVDLGTITAALSFVGVVEPVDDGEDFRDVTALATTSISYTVADRHDLTADLVATANNPVAGQEITYTVTVTNTGNTTLRGLNVRLAIGAASNPNPLNMTCQRDVLTAGAGGSTNSTTCTVRYPIHATDVNVTAPKVLGRATVTATSRTTSTFSKQSNETSTSLVQTKSMSVVLTASPPKDRDQDGVVRPGDVITYTVTVKNTGTVSLTQLAAGTDLPLAQPGCQVSTNEFAPGATTSCTADYVLTQADFDAGEVRTTGRATAVVRDSTEAVTAESAAVTTRVEQRSGLSLTKTYQLVQDTDGDLVPDVGDVLQYSVTATNTGAVTLTGVEVTDEFADPAAPSPGQTLTCPSLPAAGLRPGIPHTCTQRYTVRQADVDHGSITNDATASARNPAGDEVTARLAEPVVVLIESISSLSVDLRAAPVEDTDRNQLNDVGEVIDYTVVVTNNGGASLVGVDVTAVLGVPGTPELDLSCDETPPAELAPGARITCTASYPLTQADLDRGEVTGNATAIGRKTTASPLITAGPSTATTRLLVLARLTVTQSATVEDRNTNAAEDAGDVVIYSIKIANAGNTTLRGTSAANVAAGTTLTLTCNPGAPAALAPKQEMSCRGSLPVTAQMVAAGAVEAQASATATPGSGDAVTAQSDLLRTPLSQASGGGTGGTSVTNPTGTNAPGATPGSRTPTGLAYTGAAIGAVAVLAGLVLTAGGALVLASRPRRRSVRVKRRR